MNKFWKLFEEDYFRFLRAIQNFKSKSATFTLKEEFVFNALTQLEISLSEFKVNNKI